MRSHRAPLEVDVRPDARHAIGEMAAAAHPVEAGGLLLGWWDTDRIIVRHAVEVPDPAATTNSWSRDARQAQTILEAALAQHQHPWLGYVGDWHSHPAPCDASRQDLQSIRRASRQYAEPLVLLVQRVDDQLHAVAAHRGRIRKSLLVPPARL